MVRKFSRSKFSKQTERIFIFNGKQPTLTDRDMCHASFRLNQVRLLAFRIKALFSNKDQNAGAVAMCPQVAQHYSFWVSNSKTNQCRKAFEIVVSYSAQL